MCVCVCMCVCVFARACMCGCMCVSASTLPTSLLLLARFSVAAIPSLPLLPVVCRALWKRIPHRDGLHIHTHSHPHTLTPPHTPHAPNTHAHPVEL